MQDGERTAKQQGLELKIIGASMVKKGQKLRSTKDTQRERAILAIMTTVSVKEASRVSGISYQTLRRLLADESFERELNETKRQYFSAAVGELQVTAVSAVRALRRVLEVPHSSNMEIVASARALLEFCERFSTAEYLESRLTALEQQNGKVISYGLQGTQETACESGTTDNDGWSTSFGTENATGRSDSEPSEPVSVRNEGSTIPGFTRGPVNPNSNALETTQAQVNEPSKMPVLIS